MGNTRLLRVYTPAGYSSSSKPPLVLVLDGEEWERQASAPRSFDNLIADRAAPPFVAALVCNPTPSSRSTEYTCSADFADCIGEELIPFLRAKYTIDADPARIAIAGVSLGGLAAAWNVLRRSDAVRNAISMSGSFWWAPSGDTESHEYLSRQYVARPRQPVRIYQDVGAMEDNAPSPVTHRAANRHFRDVLSARGYEHTYTEYVGGHQYVSWRGSLPDGIRWCFGPDRG
jgi:enterochelin esterase family protein